MFPLDHLDKTIITALQSNGRASNAEIARKLEVSEGTVRRRLKRLTQNNVIKVVAYPEPKVLGFATEALIGLQVDPDKTDSVVEHVSAIEEAYWVSVTTGTFDMFAWVALPSSEALGTFLKEKIGNIDGVQRTETFVSLAVSKRGYSGSI
jgi:Lrp/AsnC family transcriptional regulator for asnA, asnC and gidA